MWLSFIIGNWKSVLVGFVALSVGLGVGYKLGHWRGVSHGRAIEFNAQQKAQFEAYQIAAEGRKSIDVKIKRMSVSDVDNALSSNGWLRNPEDQ